jgi:hypothetical protein
MKGVTIDNLDIKDHLRWAKDQEILDLSFVSDADVVALHPEFMGMSMIYPSKLDELFELQKKNQHFAHFAPPMQFHLFAKRFFSYRLFPSIHWENHKNGEDEEEESKPDSEAELDVNHDLIQAVTRIKHLRSQASSLFEKDKDAILNLLESIKWINDLLQQIHAKKLQYQKG